MSYAKDHEDEWLLEQFPPDFVGYACELGAVDGIFINCTMLLEERGWECLCIEPQPQHQEALRARRKNVLTCACDSAPRVIANLFSDFTVDGQTLAALDEPIKGREATLYLQEATVLTLDQCLMVSNFPRLDVLVLDVDGKEADIIRGFDIARWRPKAVIIEGHAEGHNEDRVGPFHKQGYETVGVRADRNQLLLKDWGT